MKILGVISLIVLVLLIVVSVVALLLPRKIAVQVAVNLYFATHKGKNFYSPLPPLPLHFTDIGGCTPNQKIYINKAAALGITIGTAPADAHGNTTFSPDTRTLLYQWFLFLGRALNPGLNPGM